MPNIHVSDLQDNFQASKDQSRTFDIYPLQVYNIAIHVVRIEAATNLSQAWKRFLQNSSPSRKLCIDSVYVISHHKDRTGRSCTSREQFRGLMCDGLSETGTRSLAKVIHLVARETLDASKRKACVSAC